MNPRRAIKILSKATSREAVDELRKNHSREEAISIIEEAMQVGAEAIEAQQNEWILCSDRQPNESGKYCVSIQISDKCYSGFMPYSKKNNSWNSTDGDNKEHAIDSVIAWKHVPMAYTPKGCSQGGIW